MFASQCFDWGEYRLSEVTRWQRVPAGTSVSSVSSSHCRATDWSETILLQVQQSYLESWPPEVWGLRSGHNKLCCTDHRAVHWVLRQAGSVVAGLEECVVEMPRPPITGSGSPNLGCLEAVSDELPGTQCLLAVKIQTCPPPGRREKGGRGGRCNNWKLVIYQQKCYCQISPVIQSGRIDHSELELANR